MRHLDLSKGLFAALALSTMLAVPGGPAAALTNEEIAVLSGPNRKAILEEGAKKEGALVWYCTMRIDVGCRPVTAAFEAKYPYLKTSFLSGQSEEILQKSLAEVRARNVHADVMLASVADSLRGTNIAIKFKSPETATFDPQLVDPEGMWVSIRMVWNGIAWNTKQMPTADAPKTWEDLLNPKYKGKLYWSTGTAQGAPRVITHFRAMWGEAKAMDFLKKLQTQDVRVAPGDAGALVLGVLSGEYPIMIGMPINQISADKAKGAPVDGVNPEPAMARSSAMAVLNASPHPHAGMLFADFILSAEGQAAIAKAGYNPVRPGVEPLPEFRWYQPNLNGKKELVLSTEKENELNEKSSEIFRDMFR